MGFGNVYTKKQNYHNLQVTMKTTRVSYLNCRLTNIENTVLHTDSLPHEQPPSMYWCEVDSIIIVVYVRMDSCGYNVKIPVYIMSCINHNQTMINKHPHAVRMSASSFLDSTIFGERKLPFFSALQVKMLWFGFR